MLRLSGLLPDRIEHANKISISDLHHGGGLRGLSWTEACTQLISDKGGWAGRATITTNLEPPLCGQRRMRETA